MEMARRMFRAALLRLGFVLSMAGHTAITRARRMPTA